MNSCFDAAFYPSAPLHSNVLRRISKVDKFHFTFLCLSFFPSVLQLSYIVIILVPLHSIILTYCEVKSFSRGSVDNPILVAASCLISCVTEVIPTVRTDKLIRNARGSSTILLWG